MMMTVELVFRRKGWDFQSHMITYLQTWKLYVKRGFIRGPCLLAIFLSVGISQKLRSVQGTSPLRILALGHFVGIYYNPLVSSIDKRGQ